MAVLTIKAVNDNIPPEQLGDTYITVKIGATVAITGAMLMNSQPEYYHEYDRPIGSIKIIGHGYNYKNFLSNVTSQMILGTLRNGNNIVKYNNANLDTIVVDKVSKQVLEEGKFTVTGKALGMDYIRYVATSWNDLNESEYSTDVGRLFIKVISNVNTPPTTVGDNTVDCQVGGFVTLDPAMVTSETTPPYADAQNDAPQAMKVSNLPTIGTLLFLGVPMVVGQEVTMNELSLGKVTFKFNSDVPVGTLSPITFGVSDTGTGIFTY